jgi:hypothetical protein
MMRNTPPPLASNECVLAAAAVERPVRALQLEAHAAFLKIGIKALRKESTDSRVNNHFLYQGG